MKYMVFENSGEIDLRAIATFGCSVKEGSNPIGFFGTGLKYALAVLLRTGHKIVVQCGLRQFVAKSTTEILRGKEFGFVSLFGETRTPLGFTTELGKTWEVWMAYRELFCNAKDEPDAKVFACAEKPASVSGITRIVVEGDGILKAHQERDEFLLLGTPDFTVGDFQLFNRPTRSFFYKGIKVGTFQHEALFAYNQTTQMALTEDRTAKEPHMVSYSLSRAMLTYGTRNILERVLVADSKCVEHYFDFHGWGNSASADFFPTVASLQRSSLVRVNPTAIRLWREQCGGIIDPRRVEPTKVQAKMLERAITFCERCGFHLRGEYPIYIVESLGENQTLAVADNVGKQIFLAVRLFEEHGTKGVARGLMEEYAHLRFKLKDETREMQNFIFDKMLSLGEELQGEPL